MLWVRLRAAAGESSLLRRPVVAPAVPWLPAWCADARVAAKLAGWLVHWTSQNALLKQLQPWIPVLYTPRGTAGSLVSRLDSPAAEPTVRFTCSMGVLMCNLVDLGVQFLDIRLSCCIASSSDNHSIKAVSASPPYCTLYALASPVVTRIAVISSPSCCVLGAGKALLSGRWRCMISGSRAPTV